ncbi:ceramide transfer protein isoform X2 [Brevipalpus obovatus]|uniref:ceramide transfer protein isoform X2 n=1 Tax=Brevipalpus obovatus TaxID=246614 RepID=UPI003D9F1FF4
MINNNNTIMANEDVSSELSDDECPTLTTVISSNGTKIACRGILNKWTNYLSGWQSRFVVLEEGALMYYKSENETDSGCRGAMSVYKCLVKLHEFDECRFDVSVGDSVWYLRATTPEERNRWVEVIEAHKGDSAYGSDNSLRRHGSALSLGSMSVASFKRGKGLKEKLSELETFRDILSRQIDVLQGFFDACAHSAQSPSTTLEESNGSRNSTIEPNATEATSFTRLGIVQHDSKDDKNKNSEQRMAIDFKGESLTFKATTAGIIATLSHCIELIQQREDNWKKKYENEVEKRKRLEEVVRSIGSSGVSQKMMMLNDPDYEEGPHSKIKEEEFFDAVDAMLDRKDQQEEEKRQIKLRAKEIGEPTALLPETCDHPLWMDIDRVTMDQFKQARLEVGQSDDANSGWQLFAAEGEMRLYKRDLVVDGLVCDPLKAVHTVKGITAHEVCYHFFSPDVRWDWENTLESMRVVEEINPNTLIFHQIHKRVWPATQRDAVFWSHIRKVPLDQVSPVKTNPNVKPNDAWIVCNSSSDYVNIPLGGCIRMKMTVSMTCETFVNKPKNGSSITRDDLTCKIIYCSTINPGGWAPPSVLRALYKREYPKFLKNFTQYVIDARKEKSIMF